MKKKSKKLQLHRETLRTLSEGNLKEVVGGLRTLRTCPDYTHDPATCDCSLITTFLCTCG